MKRVRQSPRLALWTLAMLTLVTAPLVLVLSQALWLRWMAMMALAWWLPGVLLLALWRLPDLELPTAGLLAAGLGLCWMALVALLVHWLPGPIELWLLVSAYGITALVLLLALALRRTASVRLPSASLWARLAGLLLFAALLRLPGIGYHELHTDEVFLLRRVVWAIEGQEDALTRHTKGPGQIAVSIPGYRVLGSSNELAARLPFGLMSVASVLAVAVLGQRLFSTAAGVWAGILFAANGFALGLSRIVQYQAAVLLLSALAVLAAWEFACSQNRRWLALAIVFSAFGVLMHYEYGLMAPVLLFLAWLGWKGAMDRRGIMLTALVTGLAGTVLVIAGYVPIILRPGFTETRTYLGNRIGGFGSFNVPFFVEMGTFYNSSYYFFGLVLLVLIGLFLGWRTARRATVVLVAWFVPFFILLVFIMRFPGTHFYQMMSSWSLLAALPLTALIHSTTIRPTIRRGVLALVVAWLAVSVGYLYLMFFRQDPEYLINYEEARVPLYWAPYGKNVPQQPRFGFPIYEGWKTLGTLAEWGCLNGSYASNEGSHSLPQWYLDSLRKVQVQASPDFVFVPLHLQEPDPRFVAAAMNDYERVGEVRVRGEPRIEIWSRGPLPVPYVEYDADMFDTAFDRSGPAIGTKPELEAAVREVPLGAEMVLESAALEGTELTQDDTLHLVLIWRPQQALDKDYKVFVHLVDGTGQPLAQWDGLPCFNLARTSEWAAGEPVEDHVMMTIPADMPQGKYSLLIGLYDGVTGQRLGGQAVYVAEVSVH